MSNQRAASPRKSYRLLDEPSDNPKTGNQRMQDKKLEEPISVDIPNVKEAEAAQEISSEESIESEEFIKRRSSSRLKRSKQFVQSVDDTPVKSGQQHKEERVPRKKNKRLQRNTRSRETTDQIVNVEEFPPISIKDRELKNQKRDLKDTGRLTSARRNTRLSENKASTDNGATNRPNFNRFTLQSDRRKRESQIRPAGRMATRLSTRNAEKIALSEPIDLDVCDDDDDDEPRSARNSTKTEKSDLGESERETQEEEDNDPASISVDEEEVKKEVKDLSALDAPYTGPVHLIFEYPPGKRGKIRVTAEERGRLVQKKYLNDSLIDFYIKYLETELLRRPEKKIGPTKFFSSFFFGRLCRRKPIDYEGVKGWTKDVNLFETQFVFVPICESYHWSLIIIANLCNLAKVVDNDLSDIADEQRPKIIYLDSLNPKRGIEFSDAMRTYLVEEWFRQKGDNLPAANLRKNISQRFKKHIAGVRPVVPVQTNEYDCGLYLLNSLEMFLNNTDGLMTRLLMGEKDLQTIYSHIDVQIRRKSMTNLMDVLEEEWNKQMAYKKADKEDTNGQGSQEAATESTLHIVSAAHAEIDRLTLKAIEQSQIDEALRRSKKSADSNLYPGTGEAIRLSQEQIDSNPDSSLQENVCQSRAPTDSPEKLSIVLSTGTNKEHSQDDKIDDRKTIVKENEAELTPSSPTKQLASLDDSGKNSLMDSEKTGLRSKVPIDEQSLQVKLRRINLNQNSKRPESERSADQEDLVILNDESEEAHSWFTDQPGNGSKHKNGSVILEEKEVINQKTNQVDERNQIDNNEGNERFQLRRGVKRARSPNDKNSINVESTSCKCEGTGFGGDCPDCKPNSRSRLYERNYHESIEVLCSGYSTKPPAAHRHKFTRSTGLRSKPRSDTRERMLKCTYYNGEEEAISVPGSDNSDGESVIDSRPYQSSQ